MGQTDITYLLVWYYEINTVYFWDNPAENEKITDKSKLKDISQIIGL